MLCDVEGVCRELIWVWGFTKSQFSGPGYCRLRGCEYSESYERNIYFWIIWWAEVVSTLLL